jgi:two-component system chemotaxis response regulator CheB
VVKHSTTDSDGPRRDIIVIGGSAGAIEALKIILRGLPASLDAAIFVVIHLSPEATSNLPLILTRAGHLRARHPMNGERYQRAVVYVAPPDRHMVLNDGTVSLTSGPRENRVRPAVDVLFRSAALAAGPRVIGVILSGGLSDGAAGLAAIARAGGLTVVQDPEDAAARGMPESAIHSGPVDHVVPIAQIPQLICSSVGEPAPVERDVPEPVAPPAVGLTCPECHGILAEIEDGGVPVFICRVGHRFSVDALVDAQKQSVESAVWIAIRGLDERAELAHRLSQRFSRAGQAVAAERLAREALDAATRARMVRKLIEEHDA